MYNPSSTISIQQLTIGYRKKKNIYKVSENLSAEICGGELTCLLGPNGIGKSTLLRTLSGFQPALSGSIEILGKKIQDFREADLSKNLSVVLTERVDVGNMTVSDIVALGRSPYTGFWGRLEDTDKDMVRRAIEMVGVGNLQDRGLHSLSDGERQKVMIAKALAQDTPIIFLDEPTAFLDYPSKVEIMQLLLQLSRKTTKTIFLSTHDLDLALQIADKVWLMQRDGNVRIGIPEDLALDGSIDRFLKGDSIYFDSEHGQFRIQIPPHSTIAIGGNHNTKAWYLIIKALGRLGIKAVEDSSNNTVHSPMIRVESDTDFSLVLDSHSQRFSSIEDLLFSLIDT